MLPLRRLLLCLAWWVVVLPAVSSRGFLPVYLSHAFPDGVPPSAFGPGLSWADVDQDNRPDLFLSSGVRVWLYHNQGNWSFSDMTTTAFPGDTLPGFFHGHSKWADFNQDGFPDLLAFGRADALPNPIRLLRNNQGRNFTDVTSQILPALAVSASHGCMMEWGDFDGDNRVDLFLAVDNIARTVFLNNGGQPTTFTEVDVSPTFGGFADSSGELRAGDFDGDGKDDLVWALNGFSGLYRSKGDGTFTDETGGVLVEGGTPLPPLSQSSADWGDVNGDQRLDLVVCGAIASTTFSAVFVQTEEEGQFRDGTAELFPGGLLPQVRQCAVRFVNFDGDALLDLAITGLDLVGNSFGALLRNKGSVFEDVTDVEFGSSSPLPLSPGVRMVWMDVDGNGSPDFSSFSVTGLLLQRNTRAFSEDESSSSSSSSSSSPPSNSSSSSSSSSSSESNGSDDRSTVDQSDDDGDDNDDDKDDLWWQVTVPVVVVVLVGCIVVVALVGVNMVRKKERKSKQFL